jgi:hypothetical protein
MEDTPTIGQLIADHVTISACLSEHLRQNKPLTAMEWDVLTQTAASLRYFLDEWKRKNG